MNLCFRLFTLISRKFQSYFIYLLRFRLILNMTTFIILNILKWICSLNIIIKFRFNCLIFYYSISLFLNKGPSSSVETFLLINFTKILIQILNESILIQYFNLISCIWININFFDSLFRYIDKFLFNCTSCYFQFFLLSWFFNLKLN